MKSSSPNTFSLWVYDKHFTPCPCKHTFFPSQSSKTIGIFSLFLNTLFCFALERGTCYHFCYFSFPISSLQLIIITWKKILKKTPPMLFESHFFGWPSTITFCFGLLTEAGHSTQRGTSAAPTYRCPSLFSLPIMFSSALVWFANSIYI